MTKKTSILLYSIKIIVTLPANTIYYQNQYGYEKKRVSGVCDRCADGRVLHPNGRSGFPQGEFS
jgi:hypothetical protein